MNQDGNLLTTTETPAPSVKWRVIGLAVLGVGIGVVVAVLRLARGKK
jgi:hypothetical protein